LRAPRIDRTRRPLLQEILVIALCALSGGVDSRVDLEVFGKAKGLRMWFVPLKPIRKGEAALRFFKPAPFHRRTQVALSLNSEII
jgi:hypothetical protein